MSYLASRKDLNVSDKTIIIAQIDPNALVLPERSVVIFRSKVNR